MESHLQESKHVLMFGENGIKTKSLQCIVVRLLLVLSKRDGMVARKRRIFSAGQKVDANVVTGKRAIRCKFETDALRMKK